MAIRDISSIGYDSITGPRRISRSYIGTCRWRDETVLSLRDTISRARSPSTRMAVQFYDKTVGETAERHEKAEGNNDERVIIVFWWWSWWSTCEPPNPNAWEEFYVNKLLGWTLKHVSYFLKLFNTGGIHWMKAWETNCRNSFRNCDRISGRNSEMAKLQTTCVMWMNDDDDCP